MKKYTKEEIETKCEDASKEMELFYKSDFVNYSGKTKEGDYFTEVIAKWLLDHFEVFNRIKKIRRENTYKVKGHNGNIQRITNRKEEITAKQLYNSGKSFPFGKIIDYQVPLKKVKSNNVGKIDLLSESKKEKSIYILEIKKEDSKETFLRSALEAYTYYRIVDKEKLFNDFGIDSSFGLKASPLVYKGSRQEAEYLDEDRAFLHMLLEKMKVVPFIIDENVDFSVTKVE